MNIALLGDHPDGIDMACAMTASGGFVLSAYLGQEPGLHLLQRRGHSPQSLADLEEALADPTIEAVIVASEMPLREVQLKRALQAERHVLCVHPATPGPDSAYEAALIQADTGSVLLPILPFGAHPALASAAEWILGSATSLLELEIWSHEEVLLDYTGRFPSIPYWDALRVLGGEISEVFVNSADASLRPRSPLVLSGRFVNGLLFQSTYLPNQQHPRFRLSIVASTGRAVLQFPEGWPGPAHWTWNDANGVAQSTSWESIDPFPALVARFEEALLAARSRKPTVPVTHEECLTQALPRLSWTDEVRALELDEAARRSAEKGRPSTLDLQEITEEASFKGTMTLVGCSLIWLALLVLILSAWLPWLAWFILPLFAIFLLMQTLRWVLPKTDE